MKRLSSESFLGVRLLVFGFTGPKVQMVTKLSHSLAIVVWLPRQRFRLFEGLLLASCWLITTGLGQAPQSHVGQDLPDYVTGDECLFCHRPIGGTWPLNRHQQTMRSVFTVPQAQSSLREHAQLKEHEPLVRYVLGTENQYRFLKKAPRYGHLEILSAKLKINREDNTVSVHAETPVTWDGESFAQRCAGCHTTALDSRTQAFSAIGIDCYACHGVVPLEHTRDPSLVHLGSKRPNPPELVTAACAQCHIRSGQSQASGLPYANNYVVGDDLFTDFQVDLSRPTLQQTPPLERHILENVRQVLAQETDANCLSCHRVHRAPGRRHRQVEKTDYCFICHEPNDWRSFTYDRHEKHHALCGY